MEKPIIICIDFDDTIVETNKDFSINKLRENAKEVINKWYMLGAYIIIWTCRTDETQLTAELFLKENGILYDKINEQSVYTSIEWPGNSRKVYGDIYIDDKDPDNIINSMPTWLEIDGKLELIKNKYPEKWLWKN